MRLIPSAISSASARPGVPWRIAFRVYMRHSCWWRMSSAANSIVLTASCTFPSRDNHPPAVRRCQLAPLWPFASSILRRATPL